ncbi:MAG: hypothetical protein U0736_00180 [Gemmataceae bacterium]
MIVGEPGPADHHHRREGDLIVIQDGDSTLIAHRSQEGAVKQLVDELRKKGLGRHLAGAPVCSASTPAAFASGWRSATPDRKLAFPLEIYTRRGRDADAAFPAPGRRGGGRAGGRPAGASRRPRGSEGGRGARPIRRLAGGVPYHPDCL